LHGSKDLGDVVGIPLVIVEVKATKAVSPAFVDEMRAEMRNAAADVGVVVVRRRGHPDPGDWLAVTDLATFTALLSDAGYGGPTARESA
jgi:hypothetical protein